MLRVLISGGAGFIESHLARAWVARGEQVRVLDALIPRVHADMATAPALPPEVEFIQGDVSDPQSWQRSLDGIEAVFHLAAEVGVGQSMYAISRYIRANTLGTAILLDRLAGGP